MTQLPLVKKFTDAHNVEITYYEWPVAEPRAVVQVVHGLGDHAQRYAHLAAALNRMGISVYANDHRGHGATGTAQLAAGQTKILGNLGPGGMKAVYEGEHQFTTLIKSENPGLPVFLYGQSWGSFIAQHVMNKHPRDFAGLMLTGTSLMLPGYIGAGDFNAKFKDEPGASGYEWLSRDRAVSDAFVADPWTFYADAFKVFGTLEALKIAGLPSRRIPPQMPILIQVGSDDPVGGERSAAALLKAYRRVGVKDVELIVYHGGRHEMLNESNQDEVFADLLSWLESNLD